MDALVKVTKECDSASVVFCADNSEKAYKIAMETRIDLFLVDIILEQTPGDVSGMVFANQIREVKRYQFVPIIFITALEDHKMDAYDSLHCYSYIEKPFDMDKLRETISSALEFPCIEEHSGRYFPYRKDGILYNLDTDNLMYAVYKGRMMELHLEQETVEVPYLTCTAMMGRLNNARFVRCSRKAIVNRRFIAQTDSVNRYLCMTDGTVLEIGSVLRKDFMRDLDCDPK